MGKAQDALDNGELDNIVDNDAAVATIDQEAPQPESFEPIGQGAEHSAFPQLDNQPRAAEGHQPLAADVAAGATNVSLRDRLVSEFGLQALGDAPDDWTAVQQLYEYSQLQAQQQQQLAQQYQALERQLAWQQHQAQQQAAAAQQAPAVAAPSQPDAPAWPKPPEWDPAWEKFLTVNGDGRIVAIEGARPDLPQLREQYMSYMQSNMRDFLTDPVGFAQKAGIDRAIENRLQERIAKAEAEMEQKLQQRMAAHQEQQFGQQWAQQHGRWMFQQAPNGQPVVNPATGQPVFSPEGQRVIQIANNLAANGLNNPQMAMQIAYSMVSGSGSVAEQAANELNQALAQYTGGIAAGQSAAPTPTQRQQVANQQFLQRAQQATRRPAMNGAQPGAAQPNHGKYEGMTREQRFSAMLRDSAAAAGFLNHEDN